MPTSASIESCIKNKKGNSTSLVDTLGLSADPDDNLENFQKSVIDNLSSMIRADGKYPDYQPEELGTTTDNTYNLDLDLKFSYQSDLEKFIGINISVDDTSFTIDEPQGHTFGAFTNPTDYISNPSGLLNFTFTNIGAPGSGPGVAGSMTVAYSYSGGILVFNITEDTMNFYSTTFQFNVNTMKNNFGSNFPQGENDVSGDVILSQPGGTYIKGPVLFNSTPSTLYDYFETWLDITSETIDYSLRVTNNKNTSPGPSHPFYLLYDPNGTQIPNPDKLLLTIYLNKDTGPSYITPPTFINDPTYFSKFSNLFFPTLSGSAEFIYKNSGEIDESCQDADEPALDKCAKDSCGNKSMNITVK